MEQKIIKRNKSPIRSFFLSCFLFSKLPEIYFPMKRFSAGLLLGFISFSGCAQKGIDLKPTDDSNTLLWKISGNGLGQPSYLFGTIHMLCEEDAVLSTNLKKVIQHSDEVYFEVDLDNMLEMLMVMTKMQMNGDTTLQDLLSPEDYVKVESYFSRNTKGLSIPFSMLDKMKPFFAASTLQQGHLPCEGMAVMEQVIMSEAKQYKKSIKGLETMSYQAGILDSIPYKLQAEQLVKYIDEEEKDNNNAAAETLEMLKAYNDQDLKKLEAMINKSDIGISSFTELLLYKRNRNWIKKLKDILPSKSLLIAVGAGHLPGQEGVIELLRKEGYTVEPVDNRAGKVKEI